jgi:hypothetical protein
MLYSTLNSTRQPPARDYQGLVKPVGFANRGLQGRGQGSYPATRAKPVPLKRVPTGKRPNKRPLCVPFPPLQLPACHFSQ